MRRLSEIWRRWVAIGTEGHDPVTRRRVIVTNTLATMVALMTLPYQVFYALWDWEHLWIAVVTFAPQTLVYGATPFVHRLGANAGAWYLILTWIVYALLFNWFFGSDSGLQYYFLPGATAGVLVFGGQNLWGSIVAGLLGFAGFVISITFFTEPAPFIEVDEAFLAIMHWLSLPFAFTVVFGIVWFATWQARRAEEALQAEFRRSEELLFNVLPGPIAEELKRNPGRTIAKAHDSASIIFADIVDFTPLAARLPPGEVVRMLNALFSEFDRLAARHGLEKIKTIGDAYMAAAGMPAAQPDHAERVAEFALDLLACVDAFSTREGHRIDLRIGIHTGPVVAGVIGTRKLFYDVWGDTVNTAGRMETYGTTRRIQCTRAVRDALAHRYVFERRGIIEIKGKGPTEVWYLVARKATDTASGRQPRQTGSENPSARQETAAQ